MNKINVINSNELEGSFLVFTEMILQGFETVDVAGLMRPMNFTKEEVYHALETVDPDWENVDYLRNTYLAWSESQEEEE